MEKLPDSLTFKMSPVSSKDLSPVSCESWWNLIQKELLRGMIVCSCVTVYDKNFISWTSTSHYCTSQVGGEMGNVNTTSRLNNNSKRNIRVFVTKEALEIDAFIVARPVAGDVVSKIKEHVPGSKKFNFREDMACIRVPATRSQEFPWEEHQFLSIFVEDEDDGKVCSKQIIQSMAITAPVTVLLYDV